MSDDGKIMWAAVGPSGRLSWWHGPRTALIDRIRGQAPAVESDYDVLPAADEGVAAYHVAPLDGPVLPPNRIADRMVEHLDPGRGPGATRGYVAFTGTATGPLDRLDGGAEAAVVDAWQRAVLEADGAVPQVPGEVEDVSGGRERSGAVWADGSPLTPPGNDKT